VIVSGISNSSTTAQVVINEFSSNPNSGESEWVELYNMDDSPAQVTGWTLGDGAGTVATVANTIAAHGFAVVDLSAAHLNNDGDAIVLRNSSGTIVDAVSYGSWDDGNIANNAPAPGRGYSTARRVDGAQSGNDGVDFAETMQVTKAAPNTIVSPPSTSASSGSGSNASKPSASVSSILVNELMSMPSGDDEEFVELYNQTHAIIDLGGWTIKNGTHTTALSGSIAPQNYVVVYSPTGGLGNRGDSVSILDPSGREIDKVVYGVFDDGRSSEHAPAPAMGLALARKIVGVDTDVYTSDFVLTDTPTPGKPNTIHWVTNENSDSSTVVLNELFPNPRGPDTLGEWIELENMASTSVSLAGWSIRDDSASVYRIVSSTISPHGYNVFPRSVTAIALNNSGTETVTLMNAQGQIVDEASYSGPVGDDMSYARAPDGSWSWSVSSTRGQENRVVRPNSAPDLQVAVHRSVVAGEIVFFDSSDTVDPDNDDIVWFWDFGDGSTSTDAAPEHVFHDAGTFHSVVRVTDARGSVVSDTIRIVVKPGIASSATKNFGSPKVQKSGVRGSVNRTSLDGLGAAQTGDAVRVNGVVAVLPGVFGTQYFYIVDDTGAGVQIYMNKKNFPMLAVGDRVQVSGVLGSGAQGPRVKVTATNDIRILSHGGILSPHSSAVTDIDGELVGNLLRITGEVTDIKSAYVFVDDGTDEMKVYVKSGARISLAELHSGDRVTVTGILGMAAGGLQLWPRSQTDIVFASSSADRVQENISSNRLSPDLS
jgi:DNA/RNA endonuclease YhcR with UshA esterase domain